MRGAIGIGKIVQEESQYEIEFYDTRLTTHEGKKIIEGAKIGLR